MAERGDVLKLEGDPMVFALLAGEAAADKVAGDADGALGGIGIMVLVMTFELEPGLVYQVVVEDGCIRELDGVIRV